MPLVTFIKYPIFLTALLNRINRIKTHYSIKNKVHIFDLNQNKAKAQTKLKNKGVFIFYGAVIMVCFM